MSCAGSRWTNWTHCRRRTTLRVRPTDHRKNPSDFDFIYPISPLHNINTQIRNLLLTTADHDDRVPALHSFKHVAEAQFRGVENVMVRIELKAGHGAGKPTSKVRFPTLVLAAL